MPSEVIDHPGQKYSKHAPSYKIHSSPKTNNQFRCLQTTEYAEYACHTYCLPMNCRLCPKPHIVSIQAQSKRNWKKRFSNRPSPLLALLLYVRGFDSAAMEQHRPQNKLKQLASLSRGLPCMLGKESRFLIVSHHLETSTTTSSPKPHRENVLKAHYTRVEMALCNRTTITVIFNGSSATIG